MRARQLDLFVGDNFLLSAHKHPLPMRERILARAQSNPDILEHDSATMLYIILDELLGCYEAAHEQIEHEIEQMEERALRDTSDGFLQDLLQPPTAIPRGNISE
jgi:Mg2+ and Co2+ transporter CorA